MPAPHTDPLPGNGANRPNGGRAAHDKSDRTDALFAATRDRAPFSGKGGNTPAAHDKKNARTRSRRQRTNSRLHSQPVTPWQTDSLYPPPLFSLPGRRRVSLAALAFTLLFNLGICWLFFIAPENNPLLSEASQPDKPQQIRFVPPFVQTNPAANQERIDTIQEGAQNQRAAQESVPDPASREEGPQLDGEDPRFNRIVSGNPFAADAAAPSPTETDSASESTNLPAAGTQAAQGSAAARLVAVLPSASRSAELSPAAQETLSTQSPAPLPSQSIAPPVADARAPATTQSATAEGAPQPTAATPDPTTAKVPQETVTTQGTPQETAPAAATRATLPEAAAKPEFDTAQPATAEQPDPPSPENAQPQGAPQEAAQPEPSQPQNTLPEAAQVELPQHTPQAAAPAQQPPESPSTPTLLPEPPSAPTAAPLKPTPTTAPAAPAHAPSPAVAATPTNTGAAAEADGIDPQRPRPRPTLEPRVSAGPLRHQATTASRRGVVAIDSKFSEFGAYQQRMVEAISQQWYLLAAQSKAIDSEYGTQVVLRFKMSDKGIVSGTEVRFTNASAAATLLCINAVESRSPFGIWNSDMKRTLGDEQTITFTFYYR